MCVRHTFILQSTQKYVGKFRSKIGLKLRLGNAITATRISREKSRERIIRKKWNIYEHITAVLSNHRLTGILDISVSFTLNQLPRIIQRNYLLSSESFPSVKCQMQVRANRQKGIIIHGRARVITALLNTCSLQHAQRGEIMSYI